MRFRNIGIRDRKVFSRPVILLLILTALALLLPPAPALASKALVYNATGEDLNIVVNGRANLIPWRTPTHVFSDGGQKSLHLEMANTDGELLKRDLDTDTAYVILYQVSKKSFVIWRTEVLESNLDKILEEHPASAKAAVFNSTGRPMKFRFGPWEQGSGRELSVFTPNAGNAKDLKFRIVHPDLGTFGPVAQSSLHVVAFEEGKGYSFLSFRAWVEKMQSRLKGREPEVTPESKPSGARAETPPVLQEDLKDS